MASSVAFVDAGALATNATTTTLAVVAPATVNANDILIVAILEKANQTISAPDGTWSSVHASNNTANQRVSIFWKRAAGTEDGATFNFTKPVDNNILFCGVCYRFSGCITASTPIDAATPTASPNASSDTVTYATFNPTSTDCHVVAVGVYNDDATTAGSISGTNPTLSIRSDLETNVGTDGSIFCYSGDSDGTATGARSHATTSTVDAVNIGVLFALKGFSAIAGQSDGVATVTGNLVGNAAMSGVAAGTCTVTGDLTAEAPIVELAGVIAGTCTVAGNLVGDAAMSGTAAGTCTPTGALQAMSDMAGTSVGSCTVAGDLTGLAALVGASAGSCTVAGDLVGDAALAGASAGTCTVAGDLVGLSDLTGAGAGTCTVTGDLIGWSDLAGASAGTCTVTGDLLVGAPDDLHGVIAGTCVVTGNLTGDAAMAGTATGSCTVAGALVGVAAMAGAGAGTCTVAGALTGVAALAGTSAGTCTVTGAVDFVVELAGASAGSCSIAGAELLGYASLAGVSAGTCTATASLLAGIVFEGWFDTPVGATFGDGSAEAGTSDPAAASTITNTTRSQATFS